VFDDLHQDRRVVALESVVVVGQGRLNQRDSGPLPLRKPVEFQSPLGDPQAHTRHVRADDLGVAPVGHQLQQQRARAAAQVEHPGCAGLGERGQHRLLAQLDQWCLPLGLLDLVRLDSGLELIGGRLQPLQGAEPR
jgi:hypothetical protein